MEIGTFFAIVIIILTVAFAGLSALGYWGVMHINRNRRNITDNRYNVGVNRTSIDENKRKIDTNRKAMINSGDSTLMYEILRELDREELEDEIELEKEINESNKIRK